MSCHRCRKRGGDAKEGRYKMGGGTIEGLSNELRPHISPRGERNYILMHCLHSEDAISKSNTAQLIVFECFFCVIHDDYYIRITCHYMREKLSMTKITVD